MKAAPRRRSRYARRGLAFIAVATAAAFATTSATSAVAAPPANDDFVNAQDLGGGSTGSVSGTLVDATAEPGEPDHAGFPAEFSVWYRWTAPADLPVQIDTCGSYADTLLAVYRGPAVDRLTYVTANNDWCDDSFGGSRVQFRATAGTTYRIAVDTWLEPDSIELTLGPPKDFRVLRVRRNRKRGRARLIVAVPEPGLTWIKSTRRVRATRVRATEAGVVRLPVKPIRRARRALDERGRATVKVVVYFGSGGPYPFTRIKLWVKLIKRR